MYGALMITLRYAKSAVIIGTDCSGITVEDLQETFTALSAYTDVILDSAEDGCYVLIGARRYSRGLFFGILWGSNQVLQQARDCLLMFNWRGEVSTMLECRSSL